MSVTSRPPRVTPEPAAAATQLANASLARIFTRQDGDALAAGGILAQALATRETAFHLAPTQSRAQRARRIDAGDDDTVTVAVGEAEQADITLVGANTTGAAVAIVDALGVSPPEDLALAGTLAGGFSLSESTVATPDRRDDHLGVPTAAPVAGLAHSLWIHAPFSARPPRVESLFDAVGVSPAHLDDGDALTRLRSRVAVAGSRPGAVGDPDAIKRLLRPHTCAGPFPTIEGYADVLAVLAAEAPGLASSLVVGSDVREPALAAWQRHAGATHRCLRTASTERYGGLFVVSVEDGPVQTVATAAARLCSPEPVTVALGAERTAVVARTDQSVRAVTAALTEATGGTSDGTKHRGVITHSSGHERDHRIDVVRDVL